MRKFLQDLKPERFEDLVAALALYRPGPIESGMADCFINRKNGCETIGYLHPLLEPLLRPTYGIILYQEQVMQISNVLAGCNMGEADALRKSMSRRDGNEIGKGRKKFIRGCSARRISPEIAERIFEQMSYFAQYGFIKAHATAYALICYRTAFLKAFHPAEFMTTTLNAAIRNRDAAVLAACLQECGKTGIELLRPDPSTARFTCSVAGSRQIRLGLGTARRV